MRTTLCGICLVGLLSAVLIAVLPANAAEQGDRDQEMIVVVYPIANLPLWYAGASKPADFNPSVLTAYLKLAVEPDSWDRGSIKLHETTHSLVIRQTRANQQKIAEFLTSLRQRRPNEELEKIGDEELRRLGEK